MKPIMVRSIAARQLQRSISSRSSPGAEKPVQQVISRCVMRVALGAELQALDRGLRQLRRVPFETAHARGGVGKSPRR